MLSWGRSREAGLAVKQPGLRVQERRAGLAADLEGVRNQDDKKRWELRLALGSQFDSNVILQAEDGPTLGTITDEDDFRFSLLAGGSIEFWRSPAGYFRGHYDFHQTLHDQIDDFDLQAHRPRLEVAWNATDDLELGLEGGYNWYRLGGDDYLRQLYARPFAAFFTGTSGYTEVFYEFTDQNYRADFFDPIRDGTLQEAGVRHYVMIQQFRRYLHFGYRYSEDDPDSADGNDFEVAAHQLDIGYHFPLRKKAFVEIGYAYRNEDYRFPISTDPQNRMRDDDIHELRIRYSQPLTSFLTLNLEHLSRINNSSIEDFEYRRHIGSLTFEFVF